MSASSAAGVVVAVAVPSASGRPRGLPGLAGAARPDHARAALPDELGRRAGHTHGNHHSDRADRSTASGSTVTFTVLEGPSTGARSPRRPTPPDRRPSRTRCRRQGAAASRSFPTRAPTRSRPRSSTATTPSGRTGSVRDGHRQPSARRCRAVRPRSSRRPGSTTSQPANATQDSSPGTTVDISGRRAISILNYLGRKMTFLGVPDRGTKPLHPRQRPQDRGQADQHQADGRQLRAVQVKGPQVRLQAPQTRPQAGTAPLGHR